MRLPTREESRRLVRAGLVLILLGVAACQAMMRYYTSADADWTFIQDAGGIAIHEPVRQPDGSYVLPVDFNVSGTEAITRPPTATHPGFAIRETNAEVREHLIELSIVFCLADETDFDPRAKPARLGSPAPGTYLVRYGSSGEPAAELGTITIDG